MIEPGWLFKFVPNFEACPQYTNSINGDKKNPKTLMNKGSKEFVPIVPIVPIKNEAPFIFSGKSDGDLDNEPDPLPSYSKEDSLRIIRSWMIEGGRPQADYLFGLIIEKCENDAAARRHFTAVALAAVARRQSFINEKVVSMADHDDRRKCSDCAYLDNDGHCKQWRRINPQNQNYRPEKDVLRRCGAFKAWGE